MPSANPDQEDLLKPGPPLVVILGPTSAGKSEIAIQLAEKLNGEIVSADSRLFYRGMDIGTAKPSLADRARVPHHLIDITTPDKVYSLALFQRQARLAIAEIHARKHLPFLVGGTGQYIRAVTEEWQIPKAEPNPRLRAALEEWAQEIGPEGLHKRLAAVDEEAAARIDPRNVRRTIRALEVILQTGQRFSSQRQSSTSPYRLLQLGLMRPRQELYARIDVRILGMLTSGFVEEVQTLLDKGYSPSLPPLSAIGYREIIACLEGKISLEEAVIRMKRATRVLVRRQANWFKADDTHIQWFQAGPETVNELVGIITKWLADISKVFTL